MSNTTGYSDVEWAWAGVIGVVFLVFLFWWNSSDEITYDEAKVIAAMSDDSDKHLEVFTKAIKTLSGKNECSVDAMRDHSGFMRVAYTSKRYFIYCGEPSHKTNRWYLNLSGRLSQKK